MPGPEFHQTGYGRRFFDSQLPDLIAALDGIRRGVEATTGRLKVKTFQGSYLGSIHEDIQEWIATESIGHIAKVETIVEPAPVVNEGRGGHFRPELLVSFFYKEISK